MSCSPELRLFRNILKRTRYVHRMSSSAATTDHHKPPINCYQDKDPLPLFYNTEVQTLLKSLTGLDLGRVFPQRLVPKYSKPTFLLVTDEELEELQKKAFKRASFHLHMPPVMKSENTDVPVYSEDKEIAPFLNYKFVFTDISKGIKDRDRFITVRDTDGILRPAVPDERRRCLQTFYPKIGRNVILPKMFEKEHLENILHEDNYRYILDKACVQLEPDNPDFIRICHRIYDHAAETKSFDVLRSTRFFGPMAFYFAWNKNVDQLLIDMIERNLLTDAVDLLRLYQIIHPELPMEIKDTESMHAEEQINLLLEFSKNHATHKYAGQLELTVLQYIDNNS